MTSCRYLNSDLYPSNHALYLYLLDTLHSESFLFADTSSAEEKTNKSSFESSSSRSPHHETKPFKEQLWPLLMGVAKLIAELRYH